MIMMSKKKVLIIDDEKDFCMLLSSYFVKNNYEVFISHSLMEGMTFLDDIKPDIVFLDNNLPDGLGWEKVEYILKNHSRVKLNLVSADRFTSSPFSRFPMVRIWEKPLNANELNKYLAEDN
jgi:two-component system, OmpR family, response regulator